MMTAILNFVSLVVSLCIVAIWIMGSISLYQNNYAQAAAYFALLAALRKH